MSISSENKKEYGVYQDMKKRCYNSRSPNYKNYGAKGITISEDWLFSFSNFLRDMGNRPSDEHSIERINNLKGYSKENCKWAERIEQCNNRSSNRILEYKGEKDTLANWCRKLNLNLVIVSKRINTHKWTIEKSFETLEKQNSTFIDFNGKRMSILDWSKEIGMNYSTLKNRIFNLKWPINKALTTKTLK